MFKHRQVWPPLCDQMNHGCCWCDQMIAPNYSKNWLHFSTQIYSYPLFKRYSSSAQYLAYRVDCDVEKAEVVPSHPKRRKRCDDLCKATKMLLLATEMNSTVGFEFISAATLQLPKYYGFPLLKQTGIVSFSLCLPGSNNMPPAKEMWWRHWRHCCVHQWVQLNKESACSCSNDSETGVGKVNMRLTFLGWIQG